MSGWPPGAFRRMLRHRAARHRRIACGLELLLAALCVVIAVGHFSPGVTRAALVVSLVVQVLAIVAGRRAAE